MTITKCSLDNHLFALPISSHVTVGLAKMFGFEVLRHGTSYSNYFNILENGTDPNRGGATSSLGDGVKDNDPTYLRFHVFKDSNNNLGYCVPFVGHIFKRIMPNVHAAISGVSCGIESQNSVISRIFSCICHLFCSPTLRFVYRKEELDNLFEDDPDYGNLALRTRNDHPDGVSLPNDRIGLLGICKQAKFEDLKRACKENPLLVFIGCIQLLLGLCLTFVGLGLFL